MLCLVTFTVNRLLIGLTITRHNCCIVCEKYLINTFSFSFTVTHIYFLISFSLCFKFCFISTYSN